MLKLLAFKAGPTPTEASLVVQPSSLTVLVGPNNSGKSRALAEMSYLLGAGGPVMEPKIVDQIKYRDYGHEERRKFLQRNLIGETPEHFFYYTRSASSSYHQIARADLDDVVNNDAQWPGILTIQGLLKLDGNARLNILQQAQLGDLLTPPGSLLQRLFVDDEIRLELRRAVFEAFGKYIVLDPTNAGQVRVRMSDREPHDILEERGLDSRSIAFHRSAEPLESLSDGVRAYSGILAEVLCGKTGITLIDEPEAFLHPTLCRRLGHELTRATSRSHGNAIVATHSPEFLLGCIGSGATVTIVRVTYSSKAATARNLHSRDVAEIFLNPLLRSSSVVSTLFSSFACLTEGGSDRVFYHEVNQRLLEQNDGVHDCMFTDATSKQAIRKVLLPLRGLGLPVACIVDIDVIKDGGREWTELLQAAGMSSVLASSLGNLRAILKAAFDTDKADMKKGGLAALAEKEQQVGDILFRALSDYGLFVVPGGELESWLPMLGVSGSKYEWLTSMLDKLGDSPTKPTYLRPATGDVWDFVRKIRSWAENPNRKGM